MLNFIASKSKFGFLKYERFFSEVKVGDTLKVRFQGGSQEGMHQLYTAIKVNDEAFKSQFLKEIVGFIKIPNGKPFGFIEDVFIHPSLVNKYKLTDGLKFTGKAIMSYNQEKNQWGWKLL
jgi:transcription termination factor Rho